MLNSKPAGFETPEAAREALRQWAIKVAGSCTTQEGAGDGVRVRVDRGRGRAKLLPV
jgi:hypothetical protein